MTKIFLGIGSNLGEREFNLNEAIKKIIEFIGPLVATSSVYETEPWGFLSERQFLNMVVQIETDLSPSKLLEAIFMVETILGRTRNKKQYSSRVVDIDILLYETMIIEQNGLVIPHPKMHDRRFVLVPLCEIGGEIIHPVQNKRLQTILEECSDKCKVELYKKNLFS